MVFIPTYLYIKQHTITGKLYFGKTIRNPEKYFGSGKHWTSHIKHHGKEYVVNLWYHLFEDLTECTSFALEFSDAMNIVESGQWLNLTPENGLDGITHSEETKQKISAIHAGKLVSEETRLKLSKAKIGKLASEETRLKLSEVHIGKTHSDETKMKMSIAKKRPQQISICPHCNKSGGISAMSRYHFDNCKSKFR